MALPSYPNGSSGLSSIYGDGTGLGLGDGTGLGLGDGIGLGDGE